DTLRSRRNTLTREQKPGLAERVMRFRVPPMVYFPTADVTLSVWLVGAVGLLTGYLAGSIGIGGFFGVPAMIYFFGVPTVVAAGTEVYLAIFMGAFGALSYAWGGFVDLRLTFLLYLGSLAGTYLGAYGTKVVKERTIRLITALTIMVSVVSRMLNVPIYLHRMEFFTISDSGTEVLSLLSKTILFVGGSAFVVFILFHVMRAYRRRRRVRRMLRRAR
ncbi:MAG: sulfite exporter TauE/SafE family protein, partial [Bacteroidetes bacterium]|nr:sulfite exporter TauE/SafE family protein [Bacteroidota bacterium]